MDDEDTETRLGRMTCIDPPNELRQAGGGHGGLAMGLAITPPGLPRLAHRTRADASRCAALRDPCAALAAPGLNGGVVRQPSHGRHSPQPLLPDPHRVGASP